MTQSEMELKLNHLQERINDLEIELSRSVGIKINNTNVERSYGTTSKLTEEEIGNFIGVFY